MPKTNPLSKGLAKQTKAKSKKTTNGTGAAAEAIGDQRPHRVNRVLIGGHFTHEVQKALRMICVEERTTIIDLMAEGINCVFANRNLPKIANTPREESAAAAAAGAA